jgi:addiction module RelE/StbE family toxin
LKVSWSENALRDLNAIHDRIAADSPTYALGVIDRITSRCEQIASFPYSGQIVPEYRKHEIREILEFSWRIICWVGETEISVLSVVHGANPLVERTLD